MSVYKLGVATNKRHNECNQLQILQKNILKLHSQYKQRRQQWLTVKYRLMKMVTGVVNSGVNDNHCDNWLRDSMNKQQLRRAIEFEQIQSDKVDEQFDRLFDKQYLQNVLGSKERNESYQLSVRHCRGQLNQSKQSIDDKAIKYKSKDTNLINNGGEQLLVFQAEDVMNQQIIRQRQWNQLISKQIQMLQKQYDNLYEHCISFGQQRNDTNASTNLKEKDIEKGKSIDLDRKEQQYQQQYQQQQQQYQQQQQQNYRQQQHNQQQNLRRLHNQNIISQKHQAASTSIIKQNDEQLELQISCLDKLIKKKLLVVKELSEQNDQIRIKVSQLRARQTMLEKKKLMLKSNENQLQHKLSSITSTVSNQNLSTQQSNNTISQSIKNSHQRQYQIINKSAKQITQLINQSLNIHVNQQKLKSIQNKSNLTH